MESYDDASMMVRCERLSRLESGGRSEAAEEIAARTVQAANGIEFGIEGYCSEWSADERERVGDVACVYVNAGDVYEATLLRDGGKWQWTTVGDWIEAAEVDAEPSEEWDDNRSEDCPECYGLPGWGKCEACDGGLIE